jgi:hypothetical protein
MDRTRELLLAISDDGVQNHRELLRQEYAFPVPGMTLERDAWALDGATVTHLRLWIDPDKGGRLCPARMISLVLR